jgi:cell wall-associated NlpC family hydrolase
VLAGIGTVESDNGRSHAPGVHSGTNTAGAEGPMQFLPATFRQYAVNADRTAPLSPYNPADAIYTAAAMLCGNGAHTGTPAGTRHAVFAYNHSTAYVQEVLRWASIYESQAVPVTAPASGAAGNALSFALNQIGVPYVWGGESRTGYDCSGLVQAAYRTAGVSLPRTTQEQFDAGPHLPAGAQLEPGDLVFFGASTNDVTHVGMVVRSGEMVDAPHTGAFVRTESFPTTIGAAWGEGDVYLGATRPAASGSGR